MDRNATKIEQTGNRLQFELDDENLDNEDELLELTEHFLGNIRKDQPIYELILIITDEAFKNCDGPMENEVSNELLVEMYRTKRFHFRRRESQFLSSLKKILKVTPKITRIEIRGDCYSPLKGLHLLLTHLKSLERLCILHASFMSGSEEDCHVIKESIAPSLKAIQITEVDCQYHIHNTPEIRYIDAAKFNTNLLKLSPNFERIWYSAYWDDGPELFWNEMQGCFEKLIELGCENDQCSLYLIRNLVDNCPRNLQKLHVVCNPDKEGCLGLATHLTEEGNKHSLE